MPPHVCPAVAVLQAALAERAPAAVQQLAAAGEQVDAAFYARWLKARGGCLEAAAAGIAAHAAWRTTFLAHAAAAAIPAGQPSSSSGGETAGRTGVPEAAIADELAARKAFLQGLDAHGCPVIVVQAARWALAPPRMQPSVLAPPQHAACRAVACWQSRAAASRVHAQLPGSCCPTAACPVNHKFQPASTSPSPLQARYAAARPGPDQAPDCLCSGHRLRHRRRAAQPGGPDLLPV